MLTLGPVVPATVQVKATTRIRTVSMPPSQTATRQWSLLSSLSPTLSTVFSLIRWMTSSSRPYKHVQDRTEGLYGVGVQGNALTGPAFVLTVDPVIKFIESKFEGVNVRAIQNDITMVGPSHIIFGTDGALEALLDGLAEVGLEPQRTKFQALGTTEEALADKPEWLPTPSVVMDPANGEGF